LVNKESQSAFISPETQVNWRPWYDWLLAWLLFTQNQEEYICEKQTGAFVGSNGGVRDQSHVLIT
jgi:hypothetical protein